MKYSVEYLLRYRCVSKEWCSIIDSAAFVKKHHKHNIECNAAGILLIGKENMFLTDIESLYADDAAVMEINDPLKTFDFVGVANCLVCFCKNNLNDFILFNPSTRKLREVPRIPREFDLVKVSHCGFGYDHVNDDYKVVKIAQSHGIVVMVYSLKSNLWTQNQNVPNNIVIDTSTCLGKFTSGALHWLAIKNSPRSSYIFAGFDLGLEQYKEVPSPVGDGEICITDGGSLCVLHMCTSSRTDVWLINNYGAENPWYKAFSVEQPGALGPFTFFSPVAFSRCGKDVLLEVDSTKLVWYDPKRKVVKNVRIHGTPINFNSHLYRESLLQLTDNEQLHKPSEDKKEKKQPKKRDDFLSKGFKLKL